MTETMAVTILCQIGGHSYGPLETKDETKWSEKGVREKEREMTQSYDKTPSLAKKIPK